jgi:hypothetical protein
MSLEFTDTKTFSHKEFLIFTQPPIQNNPMAPALLL